MDCLSSKPFESFLVSTHSDLRRLKIDYYASIQINAHKEVRLTNCFTRISWLISVRGGD